MKKVKVISAVVISLSILIGMLTGINVSAEFIEKGDRIWVDVVEAETTTIRFKVKQTNEDESYCFEFMSPKNLSMPRDIITNSTATANGMLRTYGTTEELLYMYNGGWVEEDEQNAKIVSDFTIGETHDIKIKLDGTYYDGISHLYISRLYVDDVYQGMFVRQNNNPISAINVYGPGGDVSGIEVDYVSAVGAKSGYMNAQITHIDYDKKLITVDFSETPSNYNFAENTVLKATNIVNGDVEIPLEIVSTDSSRVIFSYEEELDHSSECMLIFPDGIESALVENEEEAPRKLYNNIITFDANKGIIGTGANGRIGFCDYNDGKASIWVTQPAGINNSQILTREDENNISHIYYQNGTTWFNGQLFSTVGEITSISMDVKPLVNKLNTVMEFMLPGQSVTPVNIAFGCDGYILGLHNWAQANAVSSPYPFNEQAQHWLNAGYIGEYEAGKWMNIKLEHNKTTKTMDIYIDGYKKLTLGLGNNTVNLGDIRVRDLGSGIDIGTPIMRFDNIKIERRMPCVSQVRFTDSENNVLLPFGKIKSGLSKVEMKFNQTIKEETLSGNVKLVQGENVIGTSPSYDSASGTYTLTLTDDVVAEENIMLVVDGVENGNGDKISYKTYVNSFDGYIDAFLQVVDAAGNDVNDVSKDKQVYINAGIENGSGKDVFAQIMVAQYKNEKLIDLYLHPQMKIEKNDYNGIFYDDATPVAITPVEGADMVEVFMWKNLTASVPWAESVQIPIK